MRTTENKCIFRAYKLGEDMFQKSKVLFFVLTVVTISSASWLYGTLYRVEFEYKGASAKECQVIAREFLSLPGLLPKRSVSENDKFTIYFHSRVVRRRWRDMFFNSDISPANCFFSLIENIPEGIVPRPEITKVKEVRFIPSQTQLEKYKISLRSIKHEMSLVEDQNDTTALKEVMVFFNGYDFVYLKELGKFSIVEVDSHIVEEF